MLFCSANKVHLDELIGHPTKKTWKRKRNSSKVDARKKGTAMIDGALVPLESTVKEVRGLPAIGLEVSNLIGDVEAISPILMESETTEVALMVAPLALLTTVEEEMPMAKLRVLALSAEPAISRLLKKRL